ncbi:hypothetical protein [Trinickia caryophylli]|nr:hypothetical protein FNF07_26010 [Trinickia caryophylli]
MPPDRQKTMSHVRQIEVALDEILPLNP